MANTFRGTALLAGPERCRHYHKDSGSESGPEAIALARASVEKLVGSRSEWRNVWGKAFDLSHDRGAIGRRMSLSAADAAAARRAAAGGDSAAVRSGVG